MLFCCNRPEETIVCDNEKFDNRFIYANSTSRFINSNFKNNGVIDSSHSRSGKFSCKLTKEKPYGLNYIIRNAQPAEHFRISVWKYDLNKSGTIVVSDTKTEKFYISQQKIRLIENNWGEVVLDFSVPSFMANEDLLVYLWTAGDTVPEYFDDLKIEYLPAVKMDERNHQSFFIDKRDNHSYKTIDIGTQTWMAENLNYEMPGSRCYFDDTNYCKNTGRLYSFEAACNSCPDGWKLPSDTDWAILEKYLGLPDSVLFIEDLRGYNESMDLREFGSSQFNVKMSGMYNVSAFYYYNLSTAFWTSTLKNDSMAWCREVSQKTGMGRYLDRLFMHFSVRCVKTNM